MKPERIVYTRDARVPLSDHDPEMVNGWRCIPIPPTEDEGWVIVDTSRDYKTGWAFVLPRGEVN